MKRHFRIRLTFGALLITALPIVSSPPVGAIPATQPPCKVWVTSTYHPQSYQNSTIATVIDTSTSQTSSLSLGDTQWAAAMTPDGSRVYLAMGNTGIKVFDGVSNNVVSTIAGTNFISLAMSPDGTRMYGTNWSASTMSEFDTVTNAMTGRVANTGSNPNAVAMSPDGTSIFTANYNSNPRTVTKISTGNFSTQTISMTAHQGSPSGIAVSPDGSTLYVVQYGAMVNSQYIGMVSKVDVNTLTVQSSIPVGGAARGIAINPNGTRIYVTSISDDKLNVIDTTTMTTVSAITVGDIPQNVVISPDGLQLFVTNQGSNTVSRIDTATNTVIETIPVNPYPYGLAIGPSNCTTSAQQQSAPDPEPTPVAPAPSIWRVTMDPNGGSCTSDEESHTESWTSVVLGYGYVPGASECTRDGHEFAGWADAASPNTVVSLPWLVDPSDGMRRGFVAADHSLVAVWREREEDELEDLTGVAPGSWIGGVDRRTAEGGGVVDGCYIPPGTRFGTWMLASR